MRNAVSIGNRLKKRVDLCCNRDTLYGKLLPRAYDEIKSLIATASDRYLDEYLIMQSFEFEKFIPIDGRKWGDQHFTQNVAEWWDTPMIRCEAGEPLDCKISIQLKNQKNLIAEIEPITEDRIEEEELRFINRHYADEFTELRMQGTRMIEIGELSEKLIRVPPMPLMKADGFPYGLVSEVHEQLLAALRAVEEML